MADFFDWSNECARVSFVLLVVLFGWSEASVDIADVLAMISLDKGGKSRFRVPCCDTEKAPIRVLSSELELSPPSKKPGRNLVTGVGELAAACAAKADLGVRPGALELADEAVPPLGVDAGVVDVEVDELLPANGEGEILPVSALFGLVWTTGRDLVLAA